MDYSKKTQPGFSKQVDNESSLLTNSEHGAASSGYFSELSTDSEKLPPSPLVNGVKGHRSQGSESSSCEEEGFTLNFEEDRNADTSSTKVRLCVLVCFHGLISTVNLSVCCSVDKSRGYLGFSTVTPLPPLPPQRFPFRHNNLKIYFS